MVLYLIQIVNNFIRIRPCLSIEIAHNDGNQSLVILNGAFSVV